MATKQKLPSRHKHRGLFVRAGLINHRKHHRHLFVGLGLHHLTTPAANYKSNSKAQKVTRAKIIVSLNACRLLQVNLSPEVGNFGAAAAAALDSPEIPNVVHCGCNWLSSFHIAYWVTLLSRVWTRPGREGISEVRFEGF